MQSLLLLVLLTWFHGPGARTGQEVISIRPYVQRIAADQLTVCWETSEKIPTSLRWGDTIDCPTKVDDPEPRKRHQVTLTGLRPGTVYWYRVEGTAAADPVPVRTNPQDSGKLRLAVLGDTHSTKDEHAKLVRQIIAAGPQFVLHTGDLALLPSERTARDFFEVEEPLLRSVPLYPVLGNHDHGGRFDRLFLLPRAGGTGHAYVARWGGVAVVALDTNESVGTRSRQRRWLEETLQTLAHDPGVTWKIVEMHWGPYDSGSGNGSNAAARDSLVPLFERYGVDLVLSGHNHTYERSTVHGVRYVVTGGGGGLGGKSGNKRHIVLQGWWTEAAASARHFCLIEIDGARLRLTALEAGTGRVIDDCSQTARSASQPAERAGSMHAPE